jgi:hypothetical protein
LPEQKNRVAREVKENIKQRQIRDDNGGGKEAGPQA